MEKKEKKEHQIEFLRLPRKLASKQASMKRKLSFIAGGSSLQTKQLIKFKKWANKAHLKKQTTISIASDVSFHSSKQI